MLRADGASSIVLLGGSMGATAPLAAAVGVPALRTAVLDFLKQDAPAA